MFKITPIQDKNTQDVFAKECQTETKEGFFAYGMSDAESGRIMGFSQFEISGEYGYISDLKEAAGSSDFEAMFILARATMNFIDLCGVHMAKATASTADESLLLAVGFKKGTSDEFICDMTGMFDGHCDGKHH